MEKTLSNSTLSNFDPKNVNRDNFIAMQDVLCFDEEIKQAHNNWENIDAEWKESLKDDSSNFRVMNLASKVRLSRERKDLIFDKAAEFASDISEELNIIEEYDEDTLGKATKIGEVEELSIDWHNLRREGIGGSSLSECLGFHWKSRPGDPVWMRKNELIDHWKEMAIQKSTEVIEVDNPDHGVLYRGHQWEPSLITRYAIENKKRVAMSKATWRGDHEFQVINVDGIILDDNGNPEGLLECKTSSREWTWQWGVPLHYRAQVLWYLNATGFKYADVIVKFDSGYIEVFRINHDETIDGTNRTKPVIDYILDLEDKWDTYIQPIKDNPKLAWSKKGYLYENEKQLNSVVPNFRVSKKINTILDSADLVKTSIVSPYERMPKYYDKLLSFETSNSNGKICLDNVSPSFYPVDEEYIFAELHDRNNTFIEDFVEGKYILAVDNPTYDYLFNVNNWPGIINLSELRRMFLEKPGYPDFKDLREADSWIIEYLDSENS